MSNITRTTNGGLAYKSTKNDLLDFFSSISAYRHDLEKAVSLFKKAYKEDRLNAMRLLFYLRDARGGCGERQVFRHIVEQLSICNFEGTFCNDMKMNLHLVPEYGRYDDLINLYEIQNLSKDTEILVRKTFAKDLETAKKIIRKGNNNNNNDEIVECVSKMEPIESINTDKLSISLIGKWMPSINCTNEARKQRGRKLIKLFGANEKTYRKNLAILRTALDIVEKKMCTKRFDEIDYEKVPSYAMKKYKKAFSTHDKERFTKYQNAVANGMSKINSSVLFPYDLIREVKKKFYNEQSIKNNIQLQWNNLKPCSFKAVPLVDVSGSMGCSSCIQSCTCMDIAISMGLYLAGENEGAFKNKVITFESDPKFVKNLDPKVDLFKAYNTLTKASWGGSTNIVAALRLVLEISKKEPQNTPKYLVIFSDMQFDAGVINKPKNRKNDSGSFSYNGMVELFEKNNLECPKIVYFNLNSRVGALPAVKNSNGVVQVSGFSSNILDLIDSGKDFSPLGLLNDILSKERYSQIRTYKEADDNSVQ